MTNATRHVSLRITYEGHSKSGANQRTPLNYARISQRCFVKTVWWRVKAFLQICENSGTKEQAELSSHIPRDNVARQIRQLAVHRARHWPRLAGRNNTVGYVEKNLSTAREEKEDPGTEVWRHRRQETVARLPAKLRKILIYLVRQITTNTVD